MTEYNQETQNRHVISKERDHSLDILKGIGIIFVFMGHMGSPDYAGNSIIPYIYSFHMPLFFIVMGYLSLATKETGFKDFVSKKAKTILLPYAIFFVFSLIWTNTIYPISFGLRAFSFPANWPDVFGAFFLSGGYLNNIPLNNFPLWFLPLCFIASICFYFISKIKNTKMLFIVTTFIATITIPIQTILPGRPAFHINVLPAALFFMLIGYLIHIFFKNKRIIPGNSIIGIIFIILGLAVAVLEPKTSNISQINTFAYFIGAIISVSGYYLIARESKNKFLEYLGKNSLYYFCLQELVILELPLIRIDKILAKQGQDGIIIYSVQILSAIIITSVLVHAATKIIAIASNKKLKV